MKMRCIALFAALLGMAIGTEAALPQIGDTIWLKGGRDNQYVSASGSQLVAKEAPDVSDALQFVVHSADGSDSNYIFQVSTDLSAFVMVDTNNSDGLMISGTAADTNNPLTHFTMEDVGSYFILVSIGDPDGTPIVHERGGSRNLRSHDSSHGVDNSKWSWGIEGAGLEAPTGLSALGKNSEVVLNWDEDISEETVFNTVYRSTSPGVTNTWDVSFNVTNNTTYTDTTVVNGTTYYYAVSATDGDSNETDMSAEVSATPPTGTEQPQNLDALGVAGGVLLDWSNDQSGHLDYYNVYRSTTSNLTTSSTVITNVTSSEYYDSTGTAGTTYYYAVTAVGTNGVPEESDLSNEVSAAPFAEVSATVLFQHLDTTNVTSVVTNGAGEVTSVIDLSTFGNDAVDGDGTPVLWPSSDTFASGLTGLDFEFVNANTNSTLNLLTTNGVSALLDFSDEAASSDGFAMLVAFKTRTVLGKDQFIINGGGLDLRYGNDGIMEMNLGNQTITKSSGLPVEDEDTIVFAVNHDALTGEAIFWDSKNFSGSAVTNSPYRNLGGGNDPMRLGGSSNAKRPFDGLVGEVKIFSTKLSAEDFEAERLAMGLKWGALKPGGLSAFSGDEIVMLDWSDYAVGTVSNYTLYRSTSTPVTTNDTLTTVADSDYNDTSVVNGTLYHYAVSATDTNGSLSQLSAEISVTPYAANAGGLAQHIDADIGGSVNLTNGNEVLSVTDQQGNSDAVANDGTVLYPSTSLSASGKDGLDFSLNSERNNLLLLDAANTASLLDFSNVGTNNSGVAILVAFKVDALTNNTNPLIATDENNGLSLDYNAAGDMRAALGGVALTQPGAVLYAGDTVVYSFNYTANTGIMKFWDSKNDDTQVKTNTLYGSFNEDAQLLLGGNHNGNRIMMGMIGEVKVYNKSLSDAELTIEQDALVAKWGSAVATGYDVWGNSWGVNLGLGTNDWDSDGINNMAEYAFAGNPTNGSDDTYTDLITDGGLVFIHPHPKDDADLNYEVLTVESLQYGTWTNEGYTSVSGTYVPAEGDYNYVSNSVPTTDSVKMIRASAEY